MGDTPQNEYQLQLSELGITSSSYTSLKPLLGGFVEVELSPDADRKTLIAAHEEVMPLYEFVITFNFDG